MTHFLQRPVLALLATSALVATPLFATSADAATHHKRHHHVVHHKAQPAAAESSAPGASGKVVDVEGEAQTYTVKKGDTLEKIADKLGTSIDELKSANKLKTSRINPGQTLKVPGGKSSAKAYVVAHGDTIFSVAKRFGVTVAALRTENGLSSRSTIHSGQKLKLPEGYHDHGAVKAKSESSFDEAYKPPRSSRGQASEEAQPAPAEEATPPAPTGPERPGYRRVTVHTVTGRVIDMSGAAKSHKVKKGETLEDVADEMGISVARLKKLNHIKGSHVKTGRVLHGPRESGHAYVANAGDSVVAIAKRFGVSDSAIRAANGMGHGAVVHENERVRLPAGYHDHGPLTATTEIPVLGAGQQTAEAPPPSAPSSQPLAPAPRPYTPPGAASAPPASSAGPVGGPTAGPALGDAQISELGRGKFQWPLTGQVISEFGPKTTGERNDGVNIRANAGDAVHAAAAGDVAYAGDQIPGFGNLVLIKHADGWVTAYAHLSRLDVKIQQKVSQGQQIGLAGQSGGVSEPQLHFEVRYAPNPLDRARPVDPRLVLPK
jgi:murein DD-endopeptidase MepM/ murein hydrolase activator NlpD